MFFVLAAATQESFFIGNHFLWLLLVAAIAGSPRNNGDASREELATKPNH
jgi:hypothetical protein